jgi:hypothetical protein
VRGYRAPYFAIKAGVRWPIALLGELGLHTIRAFSPSTASGSELAALRAPFRHENAAGKPRRCCRSCTWHLPASGAGRRMPPPLLRVAV